MPCELLFFSCELMDEELEYIITVSSRSFLIVLFFRESNPTLCPRLALNP